MGDELDETILDNILQEATPNPSMSTENIVMLHFHEIGNKVVEEILRKVTEPSTGKSEKGKIIRNKLWEPKQPKLTYMNLLSNYAQSFDKERRLRIKKKLYQKMSDDEKQQYQEARLKKKLENEEKKGKFRESFNKHLEVLSQPKVFAYSNLLRDHAHVLGNERLLRIKKKIAENMSLEQIDQAIYELERNEAINKAYLEERKNKSSRTQLSYQSHDKLIHEILQKITTAVHNRNIPKPLILGPNSTKLFKQIQSQITEIVKTCSLNDERDDESLEMVKTLAYAIMEFVKNTAIKALNIEIPINNLESYVNAFSSN